MPLRISDGRLHKDGFRVVDLLFVVREAQDEGGRSLKLEVGRFRGGGRGLMALAFGGVGITGKPNTKSQESSPRPPLKNKQTKTQVMHGRGRGTQRSRAPAKT